jgi:hypothetical protein
MPNRDALLLIELNVTVRRAPLPADLAISPAIGAFKSSLPLASLDCRIDSLRVYVVGNSTDGAKELRAGLGRLTRCQLAVIRLAAPVLSLAHLEEWPCVSSSFRRCWP